MEKTPHVMVVGEGALKIADKYDIEQISQEILVTKDSIDGLKKWLESEDEFGSTFKRETVGAVSLDIYGDLAAATSTGGVTGKQVGRIGDVPIIGSGGYADNRVGAVSSTGHGESIMKVNLARLVLEYMDAGIPVQEAAEKALGYMSVRVNGNGGLIAVDNAGNIGHAFTTKRMVWASMKENVMEFGIDS
jgi:beta-aspartyl-peptidase (threonine type)